MNKLNNKGSLGLTILISLIVLSITGFGLYYFYFNKKTSSESDKNTGNKIVNQPNTPTFFTIEDNENKYSLQFNTNNIKFENTFPGSWGDQTSVEMVDIKSNINFGGSSSYLYFTPSQSVPLMGESKTYYWFQFYKNKFNPKEHWKYYLENNESNFKYYEHEVNGMKAYSTSGFGGRAWAIVTVIVISDTYYIEVGYSPLIGVDISEFEKENYDLKSSNVKESQLYFDIINSVKKID
jgi:hypothetical protein